MEWKQLKLFLFPWKIIIIYNKKETMIYLENNNGTQQIFIPKNLNISINKTYDEGFQDGMNYQKDKLEVLNVTENGVYKSDNGYKQVNVEVGNENVCKLEELNITIVNDIEEYTATDSNLDGFSKVNVDATEFGENRYNLGYEQGYEQGKSDIGCNVGFKYHIVKDEHETINSSEFGYDGFNEVEIDASEFGRQKYNEGYEQGKSEGGDCPELTELNVVENGTYEGSFNKVNVSVTATDFSSEQVENKYSHLAFITRNLHESQVVFDKTKLLNRDGNYIENGSINFTHYKNGICLAMDEKYLNTDFDGGCVVRKIEDWAIDWNAVEILRTYTILEFGENMTRDKASNLLNLYIYASTFRNETVIFNDGCFATSNRLNKIVFEEPFNVVVKGNPFEDICSWGKFIVKGEESNRSKYTDLINLLPTDWEVIFNPDYNE